MQISCITVKQIDTPITDISSFPLNYIEFQLLSLFPKTRSIDVNPTWIPEKPSNVLYLTSIQLLKKVQLPVYEEKTIAIGNICNVWGSMSLKA